MTTYLLESGLSLLLLLGLYKLLLENQPMHRLKRTYLLAALLVALVAPLLRVEVQPEQVPFADNVPITMSELADVRMSKWPIKPNDRIVEANHSLIRTSANSLIVIGTLLMLLRFARNLYQIGRQVRTSPTQPFGGATLVLLPGEALPHTFLHYLFVSKTGYERGELAPELLTHELTHIRQRHSLDILLVELVLCAGWFNPLLWWLKQAMQRNHEFLADEAVTTTFGNVPGYQRLLLSALSRHVPAPALASTLTFQTTKQRLLMMTKQTSAARTWLAGGISMILFCAAVAAFGVQVVAQDVPKQTDERPMIHAKTTTYDRPQPKPDVAELERKYKDIYVWGPYRKGASPQLRRRFSELTAAEKAQVQVQSPDPRSTPTQAQWEEFKNTKKWGIWVDEKRRRDNPMGKYKREDIVYFWYSYVHKNARQPEGYLYQLELYTEAGYQKYAKKMEANPILYLEPGVKGR